MAALSTEQVEYLLTHLSQQPAQRVAAIGVFAADCFPAKRRVVLHDTDTCFIMNSDPRHLPGAHWLAFYYDHASRKLEYFDSFGLPLASFRFVRRSLSQHNLSVAPANVHGMLQSPDTTACGYYCILFIYYRVLFGSTASALAMLCDIVNKDTSGRDVRAVEAMHRLMHQHRCDQLPSVRTRFSQDCKTMSAIRRSRNP